MVIILSIIHFTIQQMQLDMRKEYIYHIMLGNERKTFGKRGKIENPKLKQLFSLQHTS